MHNLHKINAYKADRVCRYVSTHVRNIRVVLKKGCHVGELEMKRH
jgi:hypothetical protein